MKHFAFLRLAAMALTFSAATSATAQLTKTQSLNSESLMNAYYSQPEASASDAVKLDFLKAENEKLHKNFTRMFKNAANINITNNDKTTLIACNVKGINTHALFSNKGKWIHTVRFYGPEDLPIDVKRLVDTEFPHYSQLRATEVNTPVGIAYLVDMETKNHYQTVRVVDNNWDIYQQFRKQQ